MVKKAGGPGLSQPILPQVVEALRKDLTEKLVPTETRQVPQAKINTTSDDATANFARSQQSCGTGFRNLEQLMRDIAIGAKKVASQYAEVVEDQEALVAFEKGNFTPTQVELVADYLGVDGYKAKVFLGEKVLNEPAGNAKRFVDKAFDHSIYGDSIVDFEEGEPALTRDGALAALRMDDFDEGELSLVADFWGKSLDETKVEFGRILAMGQRDRAVNIVYAAQGDEHI